MPRIYKKGEVSQNIIYLALYMWRPDVDEVDKII